MAPRAGIEPAIFEMLWKHNTKKPSFRPGHIAISDYKYLIAKNG
jgi:hypothetical protein